jgi:hypothetical protein
MHWFWKIEILSFGSLENVWILVGKKIALSVTLFLVFVSDKKEINSSPSHR